jgi:xylulokinase
VILAVDIGTSVFKSALWDFEGNRLAFAAVPLAMNTASKPGGEIHEADSAQWLRAFEECCARLRDGASDSGASLSSAQAIVISGTGPSYGPVLAEPSLNSEGLCLPAAPARLWLDRRSVAEAGLISERMGAYVDPGFYLPKALGIKNNEPALYEKTRFFLDCPEFLAYALTGEARTVFPSEGFERWFWTPEILAELGLDAEKFPLLINSGDIYGTLLSSAASRFGFARNVPVISGGPDFYAAILGAGVTLPGQVCDRAGTSEGVNLCTQKRVTDGRLMSYAHPVKPWWNLSGIISTTGKAVEWGRAFLGLEKFDDFFALAETAESGSGGLVFLPYLAGERAPLWDPSARALLRGISLASGRAEFARAVLEGIGFAIRDVLAVMEEAGAAAGELRIAGSAAENRLLNQIKADISGREVLIPAQKDAELLGLAIIGATVLGRYASYGEAASVLVRIEQRVRPDTAKAARYDELFAAYKAAYQKPQSSG